MKEFDFFDMLSELHKLSKLILQKKKCCFYSVLAYCFSHVI